MRQVKYNNGQVSRFRSKYAIRLEDKQNNQRIFYENDYPYRKNPRVKEMYQRAEKEIQKSDIPVDPLKIFNKKNIYWGWTKQVLKKRGYVEDEDENWHPPDQKPKKFIVKDVQSPWD
ncbi:MAG TPA: hypothetical protein VFG01_10430 [Acidobacteriota bacterium]|nr:hypothetical protein [Acidobacteriota bacterium]